MNLTRRSLLTGLALTPILGACSQAGGGANSGSGGGGAFPSKDLNFIVQAAAGGGSDLSSRTICKEMEGTLGKSIVVENRPGASGATAFKYVAAQKPDGYTIGFSPVEMAMLGHRGMGINPDDYDFLGQIMLAPGVLSVPAKSEFKTLKDVVDASKSKPVTLANAGAGSIWELLGIALAKESGASFTGVPFDGAAPAITAAIGGQVQAVASGSGEALAANTDGTLRTLAVFATERHPKYPDVPTAKEAGYDVEIGGWGGIYAPKGLSDDVKTKLAEAVKAGTESELFKSTMDKAGNLVVYKDPEEFTNFVKSEYDRYASLIEN